MKRIVLISIFYILAMAGFVLAILKISDIAMNVINTSGLTVSTIGIFLCGRGSGMLAEEYKLYKAEKEVKKDDKD